MATNKPKNNALRTLCPHCDLCGYNLTTQAIKNYTEKRRDGIFEILMSTEEEIVVFETYYNPMLAEIIRAKLDANGIPCFLSDESIGTLFSVYDQGTGGIKLKVFKRDLEKCREIVNEDDQLDDQTTYL